MAIHIDSTKFGQIIVNGKTYDTDIVIFADGKIQERSDISRQKHNTSHFFCVEEIDELLNTNPKPEVVVFGTGQYGICKIEQDALDKLNKNKIQIIVEPTPIAIEKFNNISKTKAGIFHVTC